MRDLLPLAALPVLVGCCIGLPFLAASGVGLGGALAIGLPMAAAGVIAALAGAGMRTVLKRGWRRNRKDRV